MPTKGRDVAVPDLSLHEFLWKHCLASGHRTAMIDNTRGGNTQTFDEIYEQSRRCATFLRRKGLGVGDVIGLCAPSSPQFAIVMLGIIGCGATLAPCNPSYKEGEILQQFNISEPKMVIVDEGCLETIKNVKAKLSTLEEIFVIGNSDEFTTLDQLLKTDVDNEALEKVKINPVEDVAILPYSSGTTGLPKSVMLTHKNLVASQVIFVANSEWTEWDTFIGYSDLPMFHVGGFGSVFLSLSTGMQLIIEKEFEIAHMLKTVEKYKVTHIVTVPSVLIELANMEGEEKFDTSSLIAIIVGGAAMSPDILIRVGEKFNVTMYPDYGMTEASNISLNHDAKACPLAAGEISPTVELKIIDLTTAQECPVDENGEICVKGPQVMKGYYKNSEATANAIDEECWLHTGDIGHLDKQGRLYVVDRLKEVIKYKGVQVSPTELENVILKHPKVADVGVIGIPDSEAGELPKAFVVKKDVSLPESEIDSFVKSHLVDYKHLRGGVQFVEAIPKSTTGKIKRKELRMMASV